jgi:hypothetical protein
MKILTSLIAAGVLTLGTAMAQDAPKPAAPAAKTNTKVKRHRMHHKKHATDKTTTSVAPAANTAPKK